jgi:hypothetical protein
MTAVELPTEFDGWVEGKPPLRGNWVSVEVRTGGIGSNTRVVTRKYFVQPKPKPVLPDVKPGGVVRFTDVKGRTYRAVRDIASWRMFGASGEVHAANVQTLTFNPIKWADVQLLDLVNDDGFTVELEGL